MAGRVFGIIGSVGNFTYPVAMLIFGVLLNWFKYEQLLIFCGILIIMPALVLLNVDPSAELTLTHRMLHENIDCTSYEGIPLHGYPYMTISRGKIVAKAGCFLGEKNRENSSNETCLYSKI